MVCGIPQWNLLGSLLFLIYINDISNCSDKVPFRIFADNTNIFASSKCQKNNHALQFLTYSLFPGTVKKFYLVFDI
jgi:hypothetical protein